MTVVNRFVQAVSHGGAMANPTLIVIHDAETPLAAGYANSIAVNWFGKAATTSAHFMVDPAEIIRMLSDNVVSYAVGPNANGFTLNIEQAGRASFTRAQWMTPEGLTQHGKVGALVRELCDTHGIPARLASDQQIRDAARGIKGGICYHDDIRRVLGGTTHTDPAPNYPTDLLMQAVLSPGEEDDMFSDTDRQLLKDVQAGIDAIKGGKEAAFYRPFFIDAAIQGATSALRSEGVSGAGDTGRLVDALVTKLSAVGSAAGTLTRADVTAAVREVFGDAAKA